TAIEAAYDERYGSDLCFARHIHRNPCAFINDTDWRHWRGHSLAELAEPINLSAHRCKVLNHAVSASEGRNNELFDVLRRWAYQNVEVAHSASYEVWHRQVVTRALALSGQIVSDRGALPVREVGYVAKSVAGFVYYRYTGAGSILTPELRAIKAELGRKGGLISKGGGRPSKVQKLLPEVIRLKAMGYSNRDIADDLQISASTVSLYLKRDRE
ncbi:MAG: LuxR C-terminal-related transcriptional regulator, partial [Aeromonas sp.]